MTPLSAAAPSPAEPPLLVATESPGIAVLTLNRPAARNALSVALMAALQDRLDRIAADRSIRVVVLAAAGPAFCAGHDLKEMREIQGPDAYRALFTQCSRLMTSLVRLPQPVIAAVHAMATAAGCQLVASCDLAVAAAGARFATPGVNIGLFCSTPMVALSRAVGRKAALEMLLTGDAIAADHAHSLGLVNRVVPDGQALQAALALARQIAGKSAHTVRIGKRAFYDQAELPLDDAYALTARVMADNMLAADAGEGIDAFLARRPPVWQDR